MGRPCILPAMWAAEVVMAAEAVMAAGGAGGNGGKAQTRRCKYTYREPPVSTKVTNGLLLMPPQ